MKFPRDMSYVPVPVVYASVVVFTMESYRSKERFKSGVQTGTNEYLGILKWFTFNSEFFIVDLVPCRI